VLEFLDEVDDTARGMGSANTVKNESGRLMGTNTDGLGAVLALKEKTLLRGKKVLLLGSGGAARGIGFAAKNEGAEIAVANRNEERPEAEALAESLGGAFVPLHEVRDIACDIVINATPVGMEPNIHASPVPRDFFKKNMVVMDIVYRPRTTRFLLDAESAGCVTIDGVAMFVYQGAAQFKWWTGKNPPVDVMRSAVIDALTAS
jgi:shikimate dehydrogenase